MVKKNSYDPIDIRFNVSLYVVFIRAQHYSIPSDSHCPIKSYLYSLHRITDIAFPHVTHHHPNNFDFFSGKYIYIYNKNRKEKFPTRVHTNIQIILIY